MAMVEVKEMAADGKNNHDWYMVAACFGITFTMGESFSTLGVFFKPLEREFAWSRTALSSGSTAFLVGHAISLVISGRLVDRYNPHFILLGSALLTGLGNFLCSKLSSISQFQLFLFITGLGAGATWSVPTSTVQRWFHGKARAGLALGIVTSGVGMGSLVFSPFISYLISKYGWRQAYSITGMLFCIIIITSSFILQKSQVKSQFTRERGQSLLHGEDAQGWKTGEALVTLPFILITAAACVGILSFQIITTHLIAHATDIGISTIASATALGLLGGFSVPGRMISGLLSERIGWERIMSFALFGMALSFLWLMFVKSFVSLVCFVFLYGVSHGSVILSRVAILGEFFGVRSLGELIGTTAAIAQIVGAFGPFAAGFIFDNTGSYSTAFVIVIGLLLIVGLLMFKVRKPRLNEY